MTEMLGAAGFDARRDIAGIILNRWGHAFVAPQPGFFLGHDGLPPPAEVLRRPHGRIVFAHSVLQGLISMACALMEGHRGARQGMAMLLRRRERPTDPGSRRIQTTSRERPGRNERVKYG